MRRLRKDSTPPILAAEGPEWTAKFTAEQEAGQTKFTPWRHSGIVAALTQETFGKCAYCESVISDVAAPHVEHIRPKSRRPDLVVDWQNLTLACPACNSAKGTYYSEAAPLLNPYEVDPEIHLMFVGPAIAAQLGDDLGRRTVTKLKLMREALILERAKRIQAVADLIERWHRASDPDEKQIFKEAVDEALADGAEFAATLRSFARSVKFPVAGSD